jgi:molybdenum cofactor cytidylyltransferase
MPNLVVAIVLTAGQSTRFGGNKLIAKLAESDLPICVQTTRMVVPLVSQTLVMVSDPTNDTSKILNSYDITVTFSKNATKGMAYTLVDGIRASPLDVDFLVVLSDMPFVTTKIAELIIQGMSSTGKITVPLFNGEMGHPVGFPSVYRDELLKLEGDIGAKAVIQYHLSNVNFIEIGNDAVIKDIDTREDLRLSQSN